MKRLFFLLSVLFVLFISLSSVSFALTFTELEYFLNNAYDNIQDGYAPETYGDYDRFNNIFETWVDTSKWRSVKTFITSYERHRFSM